jgi:hypothetical protein
MEDDNNDMEILSSYGSAGPSHRHTLFRNLFTLVCSLAMESVIATERVKKVDMWMKLYQSVQDVLANYVLTSGCRENVLVHLNGTWPEGFVEFIAKKYSSIPPKWSAEFTKTNGTYNHTPESLRIIYGGSVIESTVDKAKRFINNDVNPLYGKGILPSGRTKQQLLNAIRRNLWCTECVFKARKSTHYAISHKKNNGNASLVLTESFTLSDSIEANYIKFKGNIKRNLEWYPDAWICFLIMGRAKGVGCASLLFNSGLPAEATSNVISPSQVILNLGRKDARRRVHSQIQATSSTSNNDSKKAKFVHPTLLNSAKVKTQDTKLKMLEVKLQILIRNKASKVEIEHVESAMISLIDETVLGKNSDNAIVVDDDDDLNDQVFTDICEL